MTKKVKFFKQDGNWYADIPNHTLAENEMVMGADVALDFISKGGDVVYLTLSDDDNSHPLLILHLTLHDDEGATYVPYGPLYNEFVNQIFNGNSVSEEFPLTVWICNVTHDVFGEHPEYIYVTKVDNGSLV